LQATNDFQLKQMMDILHIKFSKRSIDIMCLEVKDPEIAGKEARQEVVLRQGIETTLAKKIVQLIKDAKLKVQTSIQGDKVRVTGKKRDDLQTVISFLREAKLDMPLQFNNFRD
jgi:cyclic-di-GMP-binding protein